MKVRQQEGGGGREGVGVRGVGAEDVKGGRGGVGGWGSG